jgi:hypothetical protein
VAGHGALAVVEVMVEVDWLSIVYFLIRKRMRPSVPAIANMLLAYDHHGWISNLPLL